MPEYKAEYMPIYYEPIHGSGERLTVAIAVSADNGAKRVHQTISNNALKKIFGTNSEAATKQIAFALESFRAVLAVTQDAKWPAPNSFPITGFYDGKITATCSGNMNGIINQAIRMHSVFSTLLVD